MKFGDSFTVSINSFADGDFDVRELAEDRHFLNFLGEIKDIIIIIIG